MTDRIRLLSVMVCSLCLYVQGFLQFTGLTYSCILHSIQFLSVQVRNSSLCTVNCTSSYYGTLNTRTVVHVTAAKFQPLILSTSCIALPNVTNILIFMILNDLCLLPAYCRYVIIHERNLENHIQIADRYALLNISNGAGNPVLQAPQLQ
jgi:hypothetical protein